MDKNESASHTVTSDGIAQPKRTFGAKVKRSCVRFWWLYLLVVIIVVLVIVLPIIFVGWPHLAQKTIDDSELTVEALKIQNPTPDTFDLVIDYVETTNSDKHATQYGFNTSLYLPGSETSAVTFEAPTAQTSKTTKLNIQQKVSLDHPDEFAQFCLSTFGNKTSTFSLRGKGGLKLGGLPKTTVKYNQQVSIMGLNALDGISISEFHLLKDETGAFNSNSKGVIVVPNPSVVTIEAGNVTATMSVGDVLIGNLTISDMSLEPGTLSYPFWATTNTTQVAGLLQQPQYTCGELPISVQAEASTFGGRAIPYLTKALTATVLQIPLDIKPTLNEAGFGFLIGKDCSK